MFSIASTSLAARLSRAAVGRSISVILLSVVFVAHAFAQESPTSHTGSITPLSELLAEAEKNLAQTVKTASKETAKEETKAEAATAAMAKQADAAPPPAATVDAATPASGVKVIPAASDKDVLQKAAESAAKKSEGTGDTAKVEKVVAATEKEAAAADQIKTLAESTPAAAGSAVAAAALLANFAVVSLVISTRDRASPPPLQPA